MKRIATTLGTLAFIFYTGTIGYAVEKTEKKKAPHKDRVHYASSAAGRNDCNKCEFHRKLFEIVYLAEEAESIAKNQKIDETFYNRAKNIQNRTEELILEINKFDDKQFYQNFIKRLDLIINSYSGMIITTYNSGQIRNLVGLVDSNTIGELREEVIELRAKYLSSHHMIIEYPKNSKDEVYKSLEDNIQELFRSAKTVLTKKFEHNLSECQRVREMYERYEAKQREEEETKNWEKVEY